MDITVTEVGPLTHCFSNASLNRLHNDIQKESEVNENHTLLPCCI